MIPSIYYQCTCTRQNDYGIKNSEIMDNHYGFLKNIDSIEFLTQRIENLYYCEECESVKCHRCISEDIYLYYCPQCQFEVPGASAHGEKTK